MIKVSAYYPNTEDMKFDIDYYCSQHVSLVMDELGDACKKISVETGICGENGNEPATDVAVGHLYFESLETFQMAFEPRADNILNDLKNFTNVIPVIQINEVRV